MRRTLVAVALAVVASLAAALPLSAAPTKASTKKRAAPAEPPPPALPTVELGLKVSIEGNGSLWRFRIENKGSAPVRIPADPALLAFEVTPPQSEPAPTTNAKKRAPKPGVVKCILPDDARPATDEGRDLVVPAGRVWSGTVDPIFYCFGTKERGALVTGATVKPSFGWPSRARATAETGPFAGSPVGASLGKSSPVKLVEGDAFPLSTPPPVLAAPSAAPSATSGADEAAREENPVALSTPPTLDGERGVELNTPVTLTNVGSTPITVLFRADQLLFTVAGPAGTTSCGFPRQGANPIRELFTTVGAKQKVETTVLFSATCAPGTFDEAGLYRVWPRLDTTGVSGRGLGMRTWDGVAVGKTPLLVRVRRTRRGALVPRPTLD